MSVLGVPSIMLSITTGFCVVSDVDLILFCGLLWLLICRSNCSHYFIKMGSILTFVLRCSLVFLVVSLSPEISSIVCSPLCSACWTIGVVFNKSRGNFYNLYLMYSMNLSIFEDLGLNLSRWVTCENNFVEVNKSSNSSSLWINLVIFTWLVKL